MAEVGQVVGEQLLDFARFARQAFVTQGEGGRIGLKVGGALPLGEVR